MSQNEREIPPLLSITAFPAWSPPAPALTRSQPWRAALASRSGRQSLTCALHPGRMTTPASSRYCPTWSPTSVTNCAPGLWLRRHRQSRHQHSFSAILQSARHRIRIAFIRQVPFTRRDTWKLRRSWLSAQKEARRTMARTRLRRLGARTRSRCPRLPAPNPATPGRSCPRRIKARMRSTSRPT